MAIVVDDDSEPAREQAFRAAGHEFPGGLIRMTNWEAREDDPLLSLVDECELLVLAVASAQRAWKGRPGLKPSLAAFVAEIVRRAGNKTVCLLLSSPGVLAGVEPRPPTTVSAWGDAPVSVRAALDVLLGGAPMRGLDPVPEEGL